MQRDDKDNHDIPSLYSMMPIRPIIYINHIIYIYVIYMYVYYMITIDYIIISLIVSYYIIDTAGTER